MRSTKSDSVWLFTTWLLILSNLTSSSFTAQDKGIALRSDFFLHAIGQSHTQQTTGRFDIVCYRLAKQQTQGL